MEDFDPEIDPDFIKKELRPYFSGVFADLSLRSTQSQTSQYRSIDKVTLVEYVNLPGIVADRFHALASRGQPEGRVYEESFIELMLQVFSSSVETKMRLTFKMYDFDGDNLISPDEVFILLSYIPFKTHENSSFGSPEVSPENKPRKSSADSMRGSGEGMYNRVGMGHATNLN